MLYKNIPYLMTEKTPASLVFHKEIRIQSFHQLTWIPLTSSNAERGAYNNLQSRFSMTKYVIIDIVRSGTGKAV